MSYQCFTGEAYGLNEEVVQRRMSVRAAESVPTTVT